MKSTAALVASTYGYILRDKYEKVVNDLKTDVKQIVNVRPFLFTNTVFAARRRFSPERAGKTVLFSTNSANSFLQGLFF